MSSFFLPIFKACSCATGSFGPATLPALSSSWAVDPAEVQDVDLQVMGNLATGCIRYAGLDDPLVAVSRNIPIHLVVQVDVHVSHENLTPLVNVKTEQNVEHRSWNLKVETPSWSELPFGMVNAGVNVQIVLTFKSGRPNLDEKKHTKGPSEKSTDADNAGDFVPFRTISTHVTNLSHEFGESNSALAAQSTQPQRPTGVDEPPSYLAAITGGDSSKEALAAVQSLRLSTTNGRIRLESNYPWRIGNSASFNSTNGSIEVSGLLCIVSSTNDAPPNPFAGSSSSLNDIPDNDGIFVKAKNGRASIQVRGSPVVFASSSNGRVTVKAHSCGYVAGKSTSGRVDVFTKGATRSVAANSVNGRIDVTAESVSESVEVKCVNGSVATTVLPGPSPRALLSESTNGSVTVIAAQVVPSARIEGHSTNSKAQVTADMSEKVNTVTLEGSSKVGSVRVEVNAPNAGWPIQSERAKPNPLRGSRAKLLVVRQGTEHQPPQSATVVGESHLATVEVTLGYTTCIRA